MIVDRIHTFAAASVSAMDHPVLLSFQQPQGKGNPNSALYEFIISRNMIYYNRHLKNFQSVCIEYLNNSLVLKVRSGIECPEQSTLTISFPKLVTDTIYAIPDAHIKKMFPDISPLVVARTSQMLPVEEQTAHLQIIQSLLLYHQYAPKALVNFLSDFPLMDQTQVLRSVLHLSMLNHLQLHDAHQEGIQTDSADESAKALKYISGNPLRQPATAPRLGGLQKILNTIKKL